MWLSQKPRSTPLTHLGAATVPLRYTLMDEGGGMATKTKAQGMREYRHRNADRLNEEARAMRRHLTFLAGVASDVEIQVNPTEAGGYRVEWNMSKLTEQQLRAYAESQGLSFDNLLYLFNQQVCGIAGKLTRQELDVSNAAGATK